MLKNQNGYPILDRTAYGAVSVTKCASEPDGGDSMGNITLAEASGRLVGAPLAYVYAPTQAFRLLYSAPEALKHGTLFEELYKPMEVYGRE